VRSLLGEEGGEFADVEGVRCLLPIGVWDRK